MHIQNTLLKILKKKKTVESNWQYCLFIYLFIYFLKAKGEIMYLNFSNV